jgi:hypothetical protein
MRKSIHLLLGIASLLIYCWSCMEIQPISPPLDPPCQAPPIEKNIVGTWHYESTLTYYVGQGKRYGTVTFTKQGTIIDPDSLFENRLEYRSVVTSKTYKASVPTPDPKYPSNIFEVYLDAKGRQQKYYYTMVNNECNRIQFCQFYNTSVYCILTR